jgi:hypothetical protein
VKFSVSHLGRIRAADFNIKPLTVFVGKANTNKTWTAYTLYGLLRALARSPRATGGPAPTARCPVLDQAIELVADRTIDQLTRMTDAGGSGSTPQSSIVIEVQREEILAVARPLSDPLQFRFKPDDIALMLAVDRDAVRGSAATLELDAASFIARGKAKSLLIQWNKQYWTVGAIPLSGAYVPLHAFVLSPTSPGDPKSLKTQLLPYIRWLTEAVFDDAMVFPSERKGLTAILSSTGNPRKEAVLLGQSNLNQAAADYVRFLSPFQRVQTTKEDLQSKTLSLLEGRVLNGKADFHGSEEPRTFGFTGRSGPMIQMNASASFVRSLAGLDLYLRTVPNQDVIVIDEPEMNAHPEAQIKLVELFAIMANEGRHVIVTTHSPYFVDHLNNLIQGAALPPEKRAELAQHLKLQDADAFISADKAAAYVFSEDGVVRNLVSDGVIDVGGFASETDYLSDFYGKISIAGNQEHDPC